MSCHVCDQLSPHQLAHPCHLIFIYTGRFYFCKKYQIKANSAVPDQMAQISWFIWIYTVCTCNNSHIPWRKVLTLSSIYTHFYACATSLDSDQLAHPCCLIWICTGRILVRNNLMNQKANSLDSDQTAWMCRLIRISTVCPRNKGVSMEERVKSNKQ
jgi:hypothetical protein